MLTLEKEMSTHSSVLAFRIPGTGEPGGLPSMVLHRVGHDWSDLAAVAAAALKLIGFVFLVYRMNYINHTHTDTYTHTYTLKPETCLFLALNFKKGPNINTAIEGENSFSTQRKTQVQGTESWNSMRNYSIQWGIENVKNRGVDKVQIWNTLKAT